MYIMNNIRHTKKYLGLFCAALALFAYSAATGGDGAPKARISDLISTKFNSVVISDIAAYHGMRPG